MEYIVTEIKDNVLYVGLNRIKKRNALNIGIMNEIGEVFSSIPEHVGCAVIHGIGDHFSAGLDLSELQERDVVEGLNHSLSWKPILEKIQYGKVPVIAALHGACIGGGLELASTCHIRVADASTFYAFPEGIRGIFVGGGGSVRVPRLVGTDVMMDMMLTGRVYKAEEGHRLGFAQYLTEEGTVLEKAHELAIRICENAPMTNFALLQVLPRISDSTQDIGFLMESMASAIAQSAPEAKKRLNDFLEGKAKKVKS